MAGSMMTATLGDNIEMLGDIPVWGTVSATRTSTTVRGNRVGIVRVRVLPEAEEVKETKDELCSFKSIAFPYKQADRLSS